MSQELSSSFAGVDPTQRSGVGSTPAAAPPNELTDEAPAAPADPSTATPGDPPPPLLDGMARPLDPSAFGVSPPRLCGRGPRSARRLVLPQEAAVATRSLSAEQKLLLLDTWQRSGLPATDFGAMVGLSKQTLYSWKRRFEQFGPAGLDDAAKKKLPTGSKLPEITQRTVLMLKKAHPEWGCQRISDVLCRGPGLPASANSVARVLKEAGYVTEEQATAPHADHPRSFERSTANQLWQTDLFTFILKRQNRRLYLVAFMDDHSRFIVGYGLHASQSAPLVLEVFRAAVTSCGAPQEVLTDNGAQYVTWRGTSLFARELQKRGIKHIVASPHRPQTLGKVERFWGTLWRECLDTAVFLDLEDARCRIGHFIDYYNFQRPHQGLDGLAPADRFFGAAPQTLSTLKARVQANALELARGGLPRAPFYLTGQVGGQAISLHAEGERVYMLAGDGQRKEIDLVPPASSDRQMPAPVCAQGVVNGDLANEPEPPPGTSTLDEDLLTLNEALAPEPVEEPSGPEATNESGGES